MRTSPGACAFLAASMLLLFLAAGAALAVAALLVTPGWMEHLRGLTENVWWLWYRTPGAEAGATAVWRICAAVASALVSFAAALCARAIHERERAPVIDFLLIFFFSLSLECLRAGTAVLFAGEGPISLSILLTRVMYCGRFVGAFGLLIAALYRTELKFNRVFLLAGVVLLISFAMAAYVPIDRTVFLAQLTWKLGDEQSVWFLNLAIVLLAVLTAAAASFARRDPRSVALAVGLVLLVLCRELQFFAVQPVPLAAGVLAQGAGAALCLRALSR